MLRFVATITVTLLIAQPRDEPADIFARLGVPKLDTCNIRIHIGEGGEWTVQLIEKYSIEGVNREDLHDFQDSLIELKKHCGGHSTSRTWDETRMHCRSKAECNDPLKLASLLADTFEKDKCDFFRWDGKSFEWKFLHRAQRSPKPKEDASIAEVAFGVLVTTLVDQASRELEEELAEKGITHADMEAAAEEWVNCDLVITTNGNITADTPAEVSQDGKTMTLNLTKILRDPPEKWSFRVNGLQGEQAANE